jgi:hypothetical protein
VANNAVYDKARNGFLRGDISWKSGGDTFRAYLVDIDGTAGAPTPYVKNLATDEFLSAIPAVCLLSYIALAPADPAAGVADAPDVTFLAVSGAVAEAIVIVKWVSEAADSPLIAFIDNATGLPVTPNTGDIQITWDSGENKIFKL